MKEYNRFLNELKTVISKVAEDDFKLQQPRRTQTMERYLVKKNGGTMILQEVSSHTAQFGMKLKTLKVEKSTLESVEVDSEVTMSENELKYHIKLKNVN